MHGIPSLTSHAPQIADAAAADAQFMCERQFGVAPAVDITGASERTMEYVPSHLYYILFELLKVRTPYTIE